MMKVLMLHGLESAPGGAKSDFLALKGCVMVNPSLPKESWELSLAIAQEALDREKPDLIVGASRGGALALNIHARGTRLVLIAPAWKRFGTANKAPRDTIILHSDHDDVVPFSDSRELAECSALGPGQLVRVGLDHRMKDAEALFALWRAASTAKGPSLG